MDGFGRQTPCILVVNYQTVRNTLGPEISELELNAVIEKTSGLFLGHNVGMSHEGKEYESLSDSQRGRFCQQLVLCQ